MNDISNAFLAAKKLEEGLKDMEEGFMGSGNRLIREAFDLLGSMLSPRCDQMILVGEDYSQLPWDYREQHQRNQADPEKHHERHKFGVTNTGWNLGSGYTYLYEASFQCYLRHGHVGYCRVSETDRNSLKAPTGPPNDD